MTTDSGGAEVSAGFAVSVLAVAAAVWTLQFTVGIFTGWGWALLVGSALTVLGALLSFPDVRLYVGARSPAEQYHRTAEEHYESVDD
ncbi:hypothetical protein EXE53_23510 [Halorubrum sp. SD626R]|uniref:hypothetical protein n=1 Tax=Halorubrum TaxID=56688 RepID=UPI0010F7E9D0|nr:MULTISPECIES: hypothetical protein [Halorubrum]TKX78003.1 hypothetical protein EXE53_23510 [Halorubrum sp. SD626R]